MRKVRCQNKRKYGSLLDTQTVIRCDVPLYVCLSSAEQKERWLSLLKSRIKEEKEKEEPKTIPLRVYGKGINTFAVTKTLPVSNSDSTNEVVRLALQQFSIIGNVKDFQLWVISKRDNTPYPLIGHEFPFSIQMSHVRRTMSQGGGGGDRQRAMQVEQMQVYKQCQFIMKPRVVEALHVSPEWPQKPFKRRRSLITWAFWRGSSSHLNELSLAGGARGCLFNQPLSSVCVDGALPKPVMDMMVFLYHEGSWTRGIFRRPAGARAVRELRESLDSGEFQLPLTREHVFLIAGVFKDFLRSIPSSLLGCELHEEWIDVLEEEEEEEEQVEDVKRMICRLPKENALLLHYLLAMLHGIEANAHENQMTSFNLSVCIAPSMLWPPGVPCSPEVEGEGTKKVCELVKFMIEHCQQILGEDPSSLFGGQPHRLNTDEMGSDSSYDSLENELDNISGGSPGFCSRRHTRPKPLQGSLDSILTFSDYDPDTDPDLYQTRTDSPECLKLHPLGRARGRRQDALTVDTSTLDSLSLDGRHTQRRRSEPAIAYVAKFQPWVSGSTDGLSGEDEDDEEEELSKKPSSHILTSKGQTRRGGGEPASTLHGAQEVSSPSLSSTATSSAQTRSSLDSLDSLHSLSSDHTWATRRGLQPAKAHLPPTAPPLSVPSSVPSTPLTINSALTSGGHPDLETCPKGSPTKEALNWGTLKSCRGLHPNSWLKKGRRLSPTQQDNLEKEEEDKTGGDPTDKSLQLGKPVPVKGKAGERGGAKLICSQQKPKTISRASKDAAGGGGGGGSHVKGRPGPDSHKPRHPNQDSSSPPSHHRSTGSLDFPKPPWLHTSDLPLNSTHAHTGGDSTNHSGAAEREVDELKQPSPSLFYRQSGPSLSLFKKHKSHSVEEGCDARLYKRRGSEPGRQVVDRASTLTWARLPSDPGLKVLEVNSQEGTPEVRFCLSPFATKAVRDYFSSHPRSNPQSSQQVTLALLESRKEWLKRCSDPAAEPDFDQLLFAEESYV
ncbi:uncharacterized protein LOC144512874 [Sander vitreus]